MYYIMHLIVSKRKIHPILGFMQLCVVLCKFECSAHLHKVSHNHGIGFRQSLQRIDPVSLQHHIAILQHTGGKIRQLNILKMKLISIDFVSQAAEDTRNSWPIIPI